MLDAKMKALTSGPPPSKTQAKYSENNKENVSSTSTASGQIKGPIINITSITIELH